MENTANYKKQYLNTMRIIGFIAIIVLISHFVEGQTCDNDQVYSEWSELCEDSMANQCDEDGNEWYDPTTNECVETYHWGETRRNVEMQTRFVTNNENGLTQNISSTNNDTYTVANNDTECNHGDYNATDGTCDCHSGWQTSPIQDLFRYVWCNESVYDEEYYGESRLTEDKQFAYKLFVALFTIAFAATFMLKSAIRMFACCFKKRKPRKKGKKRKKRKQRKRRRKKEYRKYKTMSRSHVSTEGEDEEEEGIEMTRKRAKRGSSEGLRVSSGSASRSRRRARSADPDSEAEKRNPTRNRKRKVGTPRSMPRMDHSDESDSDADRLYVRSVEF